MTSPDLRPGSPGPLVLIRVTVGLLLAVHGAARAGLGIVDDFGLFLAALPGPGEGTGLLLAWAITLVEVGGGIAMAAGLAVVPLAGWFVVQLLAGIALVHASEGWFVVGAGRNGMEYSVLLVVALVAVGWDARRG